MAANTSSLGQSSPKSFAVAAVIFTVIVLLSVVLAWMFTPMPVVLSEKFDNEERNRHYTPCAAFTIHQERLRVTVAESHSGCAITLPNEYEDFTLTASIYPVQDVQDGSANILFRQNGNGWYEIQFRPARQQFNFIDWGRNVNGEAYIKYTTDWKPTPSTFLNDSENKMRLTVTNYWMDFTFNEVPVFKYTSPVELAFDRGAISIGAGAGEVGGIAFEFDNLEIRKETLFSRWWRDFNALQGFKESGK